MGIFTIRTILAGLFSHLSEGVKHYAIMRKKLHISVNCGIYAAEITSILFVHEALLLHVGIPTAVLAWESFLIKIGE